MDGWIYRDGWMDKWIDIDGWMDIEMDGWIISGYSSNQKNCIQFLVIFIRHEQKYMMLILRNCCH